MAGSSIFEQFLRFRVCETREEEGKLYIERVGREFNGNSLFFFPSTEPSTTTEPFKKL
jgi:hypothetical protein